MSYEISAPVIFTNTNGATDTLDFQANVGTNKIDNFVVTTGGDILYRATGADNYLTRLAIGANGDFLKSDGTTPFWSSSHPGQSAFTAYVTASIAAIPTSQAGGADPNTWFTLNSTYVTWNDTVYPGNDADGTFTVASGIFTAPANGDYSFDATVTFDYFSGSNKSGGVTDAPTGSAIRQVQLISVTNAGATTLPIATVSRQMEASISNFTAISIPTVTIPLLTNETVYLRVRHDRLVGTISIGDAAKAIPSQTFFSGRRVR